MPFIPPVPETYDEFGRPIKYAPMPSVDLNYTPVTGVDTSTVRQIHPVSNAPNFNPVTISPESLSPQEQSVMAMQPPDRNDPQFKNSKLRTVLNVIAGGLAGAAHHPELGAYLRDLKYSHANENFKNKLALAQQQEEISNKAFERPYKEAELGIRRGTAQASYNIKEADLSRREQDTDIKAKNADTQSELAKARIKHYTELDKKILDQISNPRQSDFQFISTMDNDEDQAHAIDMFNKIHGTKFGGVANEWLNNPDKRRDIEKMWSIQAGQRAFATVAAQGSPTAIEAAGKKAKATATGSEEGREEVKGRVSDDEISQIKDLMKNDPGSAESAINKYNPVARQKIYKELGIPQHLDSRSQDRILASKITLGHAEHLEQLANDPWIKANMGPIAGRIMSADGEIGGISIGKTPEQMKKEGEFLNFMTYLIAWESTNLSSGTRPAWQLVKMLKATGPGASSTYPLFQGKLKAVKDAANITIDNILKNRDKTPASGGDIKKEDKKGGGFNWGAIKIQQ